MYFDWGSDVTSSDRWKSNDIILYCSRMEPSPLNSFGILCHQRNRNKIDFYSFKEKGNTSDDRILDMQDWRSLRDYSVQFSIITLLHSYEQKENLYFKFKVTL